MKTCKDTAELPGLPPLPKKRGRKSSGTALSNAERQRKHRLKTTSVETGETMTATIKRLASEFDLSTQAVIRELIRFALCNNNWRKNGFPSLSTKKPANQELNV